MTSRLIAVLAPAALLFMGTAAQAGEWVVPFHTTLELTEGCASPPAANASEQCQHLQDWLDVCELQGYHGGGFQAVRAGRATLMGEVTSFEQGCLDSPEAGPPGIVRSYVQLTMTDRKGDTLRAYVAIVFDFAQENAPAAGTFSITGGTGRFAGARGSGTLGNIRVNGNPGAIIYQDGFLRLSYVHH